MKVSPSLESGDSLKDLQFMVSLNAVQWNDAFCECESYQ